MQQGGGGGGGGGDGDGDGATATTAQMQQPVESASPISSRPPASSNLEELMRLSEESDRLGGGGVGGSGGGSSGGNRWPRQETLALLKIRSDMGAAFRDATVKGPLWEDVSRKLGELGYRRSAKKCKEKFENVHKYYKRTKEGRAGRQDGKSYKFFSQLEALQSTPTPSSNVSMPVSSASTTLDVAPVSIGIPVPMPISSSLRIPPITIPPSSSTLPTSSLFPPHLSTTMPPGSSSTPPTTATPNIGISFSSNTSSSSPETEDDDDDMEFEGQPSNTAGSSRKRKRQSSSSTHRMMDFFESLMKQVMQKQEAMQQKFLEVIEKREQDRMIREEAWKRQEMVRLAREHELMSQERAISASRDAAIISFLQKVTGQTIQLPTAAAAAAPTPPAPPPPPPAPAAAATPHPPPPAVTVHIPSTLSQERRDQQHKLQQQQQVQHQPPSTSIPSDVVMAIPEQQIPPSQEMGGGSFEPSSSSRWPKVEVLALIKLRSGLEHRYQEAGPKGPLWEEISAGMHRMGYKRSSKRCKEKWENINKYFKKVKESNKKRPEDAKTCPYFHELDALYQKKIIGSTSGGTSSSISGLNRQEQGQPQQHQQEGINLDPIPSTNIPQESSNVPAIMPPAGATQVQTQASETENKNEASHVDAAQASNLVLPGSLFGEGNGGASNKPEDIVKELMNQQGMQQQQQQQQPSIVDDFDKIGEPNMDSDSENMDQEEDDEEDEDDDDDDDDDDEELEEERKKMGYKVEFQRQNTSATNGGSGNGAPSFLAMVQ